MDEITLPTSDQPRLSLTTSLGANLFRLEYQWNERLDEWFLSMYDESDSPVIESILLRININLLRTVAKDSRPRGELMLFGQTTPGIDSIEDCVLVYLDESEF
jgi:hypothetical protein